MKKIVYFLDFPHNFGGSNKVLLTQAYIMSKKGYKVTVVIPNDDNGQHAVEFDELCKKFGLKAVTAKFLMATCLEGINICSMIEHYSEILELLKEEKADLIHSTQINITVEMASRELHIPHLMNIYQTDEDAFSINWLDVYPHYHSADSVIFSNRWGKGLHIPSKCIRVAYESGNKAAIHENGMPLKILSIGVLDNRKNQLEVIKFVLKCKENGIPVFLTFLGNDETIYGKKCRDFVIETGLQGEVVFQGFVLNIEDYFNNADLMILASKSESYPGVIVESMANNVPVLSTPVAGVPELLQDGYNAFLTKGYQSEDIYEAFNNFLIYRDKGKIRDLIENAYETYLNYHSFEAVGTELESYYNWIWESYDRNYEYIKINEVKDVMLRFINEFCFEKVSSYTKDRVWFLYHINEIIRQKSPRKIVIWGAGYFGEIALEWVKILNCSDRLIGFIDTYKKGEYLDYPILEEKDHVIQVSDMIFVAISDVNSCLEIMKYLEQYGKKRNHDYFMILNSDLRI